ncbi:MAG: cytochrome c oxidase subunit 3 [Betaproteobacteria bacterium]|nr:cytochrome c oxidase subunit 3 [Betaproteobacteria bacterium]MBU6513481.1 cytochrome c oxidase subunit 3 [Betaproteobacteria bacterium]MDE1955830.1 cytochrome c oxidase subunit 3 [Betaproteobacteria bacterium]MDE2153873.1 cytochrome c oxidase subunit 3 [Betaproteobacteria bacterium]
MHATSNAHWRPEAGAAAGAGAVPAGGALPGDLAIWVFIFAELAVFALLFAAFSFARAAHPASFAAGQRGLDRGLGLTETLVLLSSGYCVARGSRAMARARAGACARWLLAAIVLGTGFALLKLVEWQGDVRRGVSLSANLFDMFYLSLSFFHFMHVLMGLVILGVVAWKAHAGRYAAGERAGVETAGSYWHMVDLLWLVLFFLLYVSHPFR